MLNAKSLLDSLLGGLASPGNSAALGQTGQDLKAGAQTLAGTAREAWNGQSTLAKGAIAGGLLGVLLTGAGRKMLGTGVKVGGAALIGGLAYRAYEDWKAGKDLPQDRPQDRPLTLPQPGADFLPTDPEAADQLAARLLSAMIAAARADGHVTARERARITAELSRLGLQDEASSLIAAELDAPLDVGRIAALARTEAEAAEVYTASLLAVDPEAPAEKAYLAMLAARLNLDPGLVDHLHARAAQLG
ncbi:MAG: tellurite resistance TerB family protein [Pseudomonadota bacterium]